MKKLLFVVGILFIIFLIRVNGIDFNFDLNFISNWKDSISEKKALLEEYPNTQKEVENIKYDMKIEYIDNSLFVGGYADVSYSEKIDTEHKKAYKITSYNVFGSQYNKR